MLFRLLLLFIIVPFVELALLLFIADRTSWLFTLGLVLVTGIAGSVLARSQGWRTLRRIQIDLAEGRVPADSLLDALLIFVAGALLLTPGVLTDAMGFLLLIPPTRAIFRRRLMAWFRSRFRINSLGNGSWSATAGTELPGKSEVIDSHVVER